MASHVIDWTKTYKALEIEVGDTLVLQKTPRTTYDGPKTSGRTYGHYLSFGSGMTVGTLSLERPESPYKKFLTPFTGSGTYADDKECLVDTDIYGTEFDEEDVAYAKGWFESATRIPIYLRQFYTPVSGTVISATVYGSAKTVYVSVPASEVPTVTATLGESAATQHIADHFGAFVQNRSVLASSIIATPPNGTYIQRIDVYEGADASGRYIGGAEYGYTLDPNSITGESIPPDRGAINLTVTESQPITTLSGQRTIVVTDARGRTATTTINFTALPNTPLSLSMLALERTDDQGISSNTGSYARYKVQGFVQSLKPDQTELNTAQLTLRWRIADTLLAWTEINVPVSVGMISVNAFLGDTYEFDADASYTFEAILTDYFGSVSRQGILAQAFTLLDFGADGKTLGVGKYASRAGIMDVGLETNFDKLVTLSGGLSIGGGGALPKDMGGLGADVSAQTALNAAIGRGAATGTLVSYTIATGVYGAQRITWDALELNDQFDSYQIADQINGIIALQAGWYTATLHNRTNSSSITSMLAALMQFAAGSTPPATTSAGIDTIAGMTRYTLVYIPGSGDYRRGMVTDTFYLQAGEILIPYLRPTGGSISASNTQGTFTIAKIG
ncbi:DUF859 domain-containing protein [Eubacteriales bacterium OttesenSCG-928-N13]|nr:DUF859 domain-containing protein [Eubacteriales bacterium OttesenSCG-928-N13]